MHCLKTLREDRTCRTMGLHKPHRHNMQNKPDCGQSIAAYMSCTLPYLVPVSCTRDCACDMTKKRHMTNSNVFVDLFQPLFQPILPLLLKDNHPKSGKGEQYSCASLSSPSWVSVRVVRALSSESDLVTHSTSPQAQTALASSVTAARDDNATNSPSSSLHPHHSPRPLSP